LNDLATPHDVPELLVKIDNRFFRQPMANADDKLFANPARRVINLIELQNFRDRFFNVVHDFEEGKIF